MSIFCPFVATLFAKSLFAVTNSDILSELDLTLALVCLIVSSMLLIFDVAVSLRSFISCSVTVNSLRSSLYLVSEVFSNSFFTEEIVLFIC
nr:MAG TPA: hypothetical protein [Caudoviricetes sp.]